MTNSIVTTMSKMPSPAISTANPPSARTVRVQVITPPCALDRAGRRQITREATDIIANAAGDPSLAARTWVILTEAAEGGWCLAGTAFGVAEFADLAKKAAAARA